MSGKSKFTEERDARKDPAGLGDRSEGEMLLSELDAELQEALGNFRISVHAWSEDVFSRPRTGCYPAPRGRVWRLAAGWALGCVLVVGAVSGGVYEGVHQRHQRQALALAAAAQASEQQRLAAEQKAREEDELLAKVDSVVSRTVPSAMEPLAQLMALDESSGETR